MLTVPQYLLSLNNGIYISGYTHNIWVSLWCDIARKFGRVVFLCFQNRSQIPKKEASNFKITYD